MDKILATIMLLGSPFIIALAVAGLKWESNEKKRDAARAAAKRRAPRETQRDYADRQW